MNTPLKNCEEIASELNRLYRAYQHAVSVNEFHQMAEIRKTFEELWMKAVEVTQFVHLNSIEKYEMLIGPSEILRRNAEEKNTAVKEGRYEDAAMKRDFEKQLLDRFLREKGFNPEEQFYCANGRVFYKD